MTTSDTGDGIVQVAYLHSEHVSHSWVESMRRMWEHDLENGRRIARKPLNMRCGAGLLAVIRNYGARLFLDRTPHEWLLWIDTDMGFREDAVHRLLDEAAHPIERPVAGALCFAFMEDKYDGMGGWRRTIVPTMYKIGESEQGPSFCYYGDYVDGQVTPVAATGAAFLLIHRTVLEKLRAEHGDHWFDMFYDSAGDIVGEDIAFCARLNKAGVVPVVHTGVKTSHHKEIWLSELDYEVQRAVSIQVDPDLLIGDEAFVSGGGDEITRLESLLEHLRKQKAAAEFTTTAEATA